MEQLQFDILPLLWWQNPWYLLPLSGGIGALLLLIIGVSWYAYRKRWSYPHNRLRELAVLEKAFESKKMTTGQVYTKLVHLIQEWFLKKYTVGGSHLTESELLDLVHEKLAVDFALPMSAVLRHAEQERFAAQRVHEHQVTEDIASVRALMQYIPQK